MWSERIFNKTFLLLNKHLTIECKIIFFGGYLKIWAWESAMNKLFNVQSIKGRFIWVVKCENVFPYELLGF